MRNTKQWCQYLLLTIMLWCFALPNIVAQPGADPNDMTFADAYAALIEAGYADCLATVSFTDDATAQDLFDFVLTSGCQPNGGMPGDTIIWDGEWTIADEIAYLTSIGLGECFEGAPEFASYDELYNYLYSCPAYIDYATWDINDEIAWLVSAGYGSCIEGIEFIGI